MKTRAFLDAINNGYARMLLNEDEREQMDVLLTTLNKYIGETPQEGDVFELTLSDDRKIIGARKLVEETERGWRLAKALNDWLLDGIYSPELEELEREKNV